MFWNKKNNRYVMSEEVKKKALIFVECPAGSGHIEVADSMRKALEGKNIDAYIVSHDFTADMAAERSVPKDRLIQLPDYLTNSERQDKSFVHNDYKASSDESLAVARSKVMNDWIKENKPEVIITEMWPVARKRHDVELRDMLTTIDKTIDYSPKLYSIERPIIAGQPDFEARVKDNSAAFKIISEKFDKVFIRGDKALLKFSPKEQGSVLLNSNTEYVGFFNAKPPKEVKVDKNQILIASGGDWQGRSASLIRTFLMSLDYLYSNNALTTEQCALKESLADKEVLIRVTPKITEKDKKGSYIPD